MFPLLCLVMISEIWIVVKGSFASLKTKSIMKLLEY